MLRAFVPRFCYFVPVRLHRPTGASKRLRPRRTSRERLAALQHINHIFSTDLFVTLLVHSQRDTYCCHIGVPLCVCVLRMRAWPENAFATAGPFVAQQTVLSFLGALIFLFSAHQNPLLHAPVLGGAGRCCLSWVP